MPSLRTSVEYFGLDTRRITLREFLFETKNPLTLALAVVIFKLLRIRLPPGGSTDDPTVDRLAPFESSLDRLPALAHAPTIERADALAALGFVEPIVHVVPTPLQSTEHAMVTLRAPDGRSAARAHTRVSHLRQPPKVKPYVELISALADGTFVWTANGVRDTIEPATCAWERVAKLSVADVVALHARRLDALPPGTTIVPATDVRQLVDAHHAAVVAFHRKRGVFTAVDPAAVAGLARVSSLRGDVADAPVLLEIDRQLNKGGSWQTSIVLFVITLLAFVALGANRWGGSFVAMLVPILLVHELGHHVAMRGFGYRNVRMFFLPLVGAAVSGRSFNVSAWKQVIVSLAGPVPGILLAIPIGLVGLVRHVPWMNELALTTLALNGFNLLPILPLDGGRVAQLLLFRRTPMLDVAFRVIAVLGVIGLAFLTGDRFLGYFAVGLGLSVPMAVRVAAATRRMRRRHPAPILVPDGASGLPPEVAGEIIGELRAGRRGPIATKILATQVLEVFDALNSRAPRWPATLGFGLVHVGSIALVIVSATTFAILQNASLMRAMGVLATPRPLLDPNDVEARRGDHYDAAAKHALVVAHFAKAAQAKTAFASLAPADVGAVCRLGPAILVELSSDDASDRDAAFDALDAAGGKPSVDKGGWAMLTLVARTASPATADAIVADVGIGAPDGLVPPWIDADPRPADVRSAHARARRTEALLQRVQSERFRAQLDQLKTRGDAAVAASDPSQKAIDAARRRGNKAEASRLIAAQADDERQSTLAAPDAALTAAPSNDVDPAYVEIWKALNVPANDGAVAAFDEGDEDESPASGTAEAERFRRRAAEREQLRQRQATMLGALPRIDGRPTAESIVWWSDANATADERVATLNVTQRSPAVTLPVIVRWMATRSKELHFELEPGVDWIERSADRKATIGPTTREGGMKGQVLGSASSASLAAEVWQFGLDDAPRDLVNDRVVAMDELVRD